MPSQLPGSWITQPTDPYARRRVECPQCGGDGCFVGQFSGVLRSCLLCNGTGAIPEPIAAWEERLEGFHEANAATFPWERPPEFRQSLREEP